MALTIVDLPMIQLDRSRQQRQVIDPEDDWTGVMSSRERRKLQNRLNQRAYRMRKRGHDRCPDHLIPQDVVREDEKSQPGSKHCVLALPETRAMLRSFANAAHRDYTVGVLRPSCLSLLIRVNILNALIQNAEAIGVTSEYLCNDDAISPFNRRGPSILPDTYPTSLHPTAVQRTVLHHPWLDLFPIPCMRDKLILACETMDEYEMCRDMVDVCEGPEEKANLIIWGDPADPRGWEASVSFLRKWGWTIRGCPELLEATNYWRGLRGERRLVFEVT